MLNTATSLIFLGTVEVEHHSENHQLVYDSPDNVATKDRYLSDESAVRVVFGGEEVEHVGAAKVPACSDTAHVRGPSQPFESLALERIGPLARFPARQTPPSLSRPPPPPWPPHSLAGSGPPPHANTSSVRSLPFLAVPSTHFALCRYPLLGSGL